MEFTSKKNSEEKLRDLINQKNSIKEKHQKEKYELENQVKLLEGELEKDLDFDKYKEFKEKYDFYKNKLSKFLKKKEPTPLEIEREIEKEFSERCRAIETEHEEKVSAAYEKLKASLEDLTLLIDERNEKGSKLNQVVQGEDSSKGKSLNFELVSSIRRGDIKIYRDNWGMPIIEEFKGISSDPGKVRIS